MSIFNLANIPDMSTLCVSECIANIGTALLNLSHDHGNYFRMLVIHIMLFR